MDKIKISLCNYIAGAGKDTVAQYLVEEHGFKSYAFSDGIYEIKEKIFGIYEKDRATTINIGEKLREIDMFVWIKETLRRIEKDGHDRVVITDTRKLLEYAYLLETGWHNVMVYCDEQEAIKRLKERDKEVDEEIVLNGTTENQLRPLQRTMKVFDNTGDFEELKKEIDAYVRFLSVGK